MESIPQPACWTAPFPQAGSKSQFADVRFCDILLLTVHVDALLLIVVFCMDFGLVPSPVLISCLCDKGKESSPLMNIPLVAAFAELFIMCRLLRCESYEGLMCCKMLSAVCGLAPLRSVLSIPLCIKPSSGELLLYMAAGTLLLASHSSVCFHLW